MASEPPSRLIDTRAVTGRVPAAESDGKDVTCADATAAKRAEWSAHGVSITANSIKEEDSDRTRASNVAGVLVYLIVITSHILMTLLLP
jgi:hypothetical protein